MMAMDGIFGPASPVRRMLRPLGIAASGLSAQSFKMETIAENIANADVTRTAEGGAYRRKVVELESRPSPDADFLSGSRLELSLPPLPGEAAEEGGVRVAGVAADATEGPLVYDPGHPDADEAGYVRYPNVDITEETVDMLVARRAYDANATVFQVLKSVLHKALEI